MGTGTAVAGRHCYELRSALQRAPRLSLPRLFAFLSLSLSLSAQRPSRAAARARPIRRRSAAYEHVRN